MRYSTVIFDIDDTLFDYKKTEELALETVCNNLGIQYCQPHTYTLYKQANNKAKSIIDIQVPKNLNNFRALRAELFLDLIGRNDITLENFVAFYLENSTTGILIDGVKETLEQLKGCTFFAATNGSDYPRKNKLMNSQIADYFAQYYSSEKLGISKPNPQFFNAILEEQKIMRDQVFIVGDNFLTDIQGAVAAKIDCCWFNYKNDTLNTPPTYGVTVIKAFNELVNIVKG